MKKDFKNPGHSQNLPHCPRPAGFERKSFYFLLFLLFFSIGAFAQSSITGTVKDTNGEPLAGVTVNVKGSNNGSTTDVAGRYSIAGVGKNAVLVFSFVGFKTQEIAVADRKGIDVSMEGGVSDLGQVVVVGYGSQSRQTVTTSITKLDDKVLKNVTYANAGSAMQGTLSGVRVQSVNGQPGAALRIIVRGGTSINNPNGAAPLYIVDGVIRPDINDINSDDIESIQVLKDAAATAIYGARGSNGVVIIVTKSGKKGVAQINYKYDLMLSSAGKRMEFMNARDYLRFQRIGIQQGVVKNNADASTLAQLVAAQSYGTGNDFTNNTVYTTQYLTPDNQYKLSEGWESMPDPIDPTKTLIFKETNFQDHLFKTGISHNHYLSVSGGTDKATFNAAVGYLANDGIVIHSDYKRITLDLNGSLQVRDNLSVTGRLAYSNSGSNNVVGNPFYRTMGAPPTMKYTFEDGSLAPGPGVTLFNPEYSANSMDAKNSLDNLTMSLSAHWQILPGLAFDPMVSLYRKTADARSFQKAAFLNGPIGIVDSRNASGSYAKLIQDQADAVFTYNKSFNHAHNFEAKAGFSYFDAQNSSLSASGRGAASDLIPTLNASSQPVAVSGSEDDLKIFGYFARVNYDYRQKYLLSASARYDGASNLGENHKWGVFPGISAGWNIHKEAFWKSFPSVLSQLKLRGSFGVNGNISGLGPYQAQGQYSVGSKYGGAAAIQNTILANSELKWEQSKTYDAGLDLGLWENRVTILFDYYRRVTDNLLTSLALPQSTGFASTLTNLGSLENKGVELEISARILPNTSAFQWNVSFNASKVQNKILRLPYNGVENNRIGGVYVWDSKKKDYSWQGGLQEGGRMGDLFAYKEIGVYSTDQAAASAPTDMIMTGITDRTKFGGDVNWLDADGNGLIDDKDRVNVGNTYPTWTGGFSNTFSYKNLELYVRMDYETGHTIYDYLLVEATYQTHGNNGISTLELKSWQKPGDVTDIPQYLWFDRNRRSISRGNSMFYEKGDYLAIREVTLSYNLPARFLKRIKLSNVRFNATANNLYYLTKYRGLNPENGDQDNGRYPVPRVFEFGANVTF